MLLLSTTSLLGWVARPNVPTSRRALHPAAHVLLGLTQVVTDIDDTVKSSGGVTLAGIPLGGVDTSFARNSFYPGVFQFGLELASHTAKAKQIVTKACES